MHCPHSAGIQPKISYLKNHPPNARLHTPSSVTKFGIHSSIKPKINAFVGITTTTPQKEPPQSSKSTHKPADLCYVLLCMGALLHAEPKPRACLRLFACDGNEAEKVSQITDCFAILTQLCLVLYNHIVLMVMLSGFIFCLSLGRPPGTAN